MLLLKSMPASAAAAEEESSDVPRAVPGQLVVRYEHASTPAERAAARRHAGVRAVRELAPSTTQLVEVRGKLTAAALVALRENADVKQVSRNWLRRPIVVPNDPFFDELWGLHNTGQPVGQTDPTSGTPDADIDGPESWDVQPSWGPGAEPGIVVAVMDTGADLGHAELQGRLWSNPDEVPGNGIDDDKNGYVDDVHGYDFAGEDLEDFFDGDADPDDPDGHGTHVAGTILAEGNNGEGVVGVSAGSRLMTLKVCALDDEGEAACPLDAILEAYEYAITNGAAVLNGSLGGPDFSTLEVGLLSANPQVLFVFAAGNGGEDGVGDDNDSDPSYPCALDEEAGYTANNLICVAATTQTDGLAGFSNFGAASVDLAAPGVRILSTYPEALTPSEFLPYAYFSGTSMATPHVTGAAALLIAVAPALSAEQAKSAILESAEQRPSLLGKTVSGGRLNARLALEGVGVKSPPSDPEEDDVGEEGDGGNAGASPPVPPPPIATPDRVAPRTFIKKRPRKVVFTPWRRGRAVFKFRSNEPGALFFCQFDRKRWRRCGPRFVRWFLPGRHVLRVKARDAAGNVDPTPAVHRFRVRRVSKKQFARLKRASRRARRDRR